MPGNHGYFIRATRALREGGLIAYPTEAVYGLGCDPFNPDAVAHLRYLKRRPTDKGLLLIASDLEQISPLIGPINHPRWQAITSHWPGPITWVLPSSDAVPPWLSAADGSIAIRVTRHPIASALCRAFQSPIVSTSANHRGANPARTALAVRKQFGRAVMTIVSGPVGGNEHPSAIYRASDGACLRP